MPEESNKPEKTSDSSAKPAQGQKSEWSNTESNQFKRRSCWVSSYAALKYIGGISRKNFRQSDKVTGILAGISILILALMFFAPVHLLQLPLGLLLDSIFAASIILFVANRLGILTALPERQAVLVWELLLGVFALAMFILLNIAVIITLMMQMPKMF